jgi:23S rRNA pseudouridine2604 synthase
MTNNITFTVKEISRINKAIATAGFYSRKQSDELIEKRKVLINKKIAELGQIVNVGDIVEIKQNKNNAKDFLYAIYYKPVGEVTGISQKDKLKDLHPIGRLDKNSEGLLIYSNDYNLVDKILNPKSKIEKQYEVRVREKATPRVARILLDGITTQEAKYGKVKDVRISEDKQTIFITLTEGKKHEIRRMLNALHLTILSLKRTKIHKFTINNLGNMRSGQVRELTQNDFKDLLQK